jgi:hypothetical protein
MARSSARPEEARVGEHRARIRDLMGLGKREATRAWIVRMLCTAGSKSPDSACILRQPRRTDSSSVRVGVGGWGVEEGTGEDRIG